MSFASLKSKSGQFGKLTQQIEKMSKPQGAGPDERLWKPEVDKSGNGYAVIRFLQSLKVKTFLGHRYGVTHSKDQAVGTLRIPSLHLTKRIQSETLTGLYGIVD